MSKPHAHSRTPRTPVIKGNRILARAALAVAIAAGSLTVSHTTPVAAQTSPTAAISDLVQDIQSRYFETKTALHSDTLSDQEKSLRIDAFFAEVEASCKSRCPLLISTLEDLNSRNTPERRQAVVDFVAKLAPEPATEQVKVSIDTAANMALRLQEHLKTSPVDFEHRVHASLAAARALVAFQEEALLQSLSKDTETAREGREKIAKDIAFFKKQAAALWDIGQVVREFKATERVRPEEMQKVVQRVSDLGIFYIKLAQTLSNLTFVLPPEASEPLRVFQDKVTPIGPEEVVRIMTRELGRSPHEVFEFDPSKPLASGSIAVTFEAKLRENGQTVILKVQRPGLEEELEFNRRFNKFAMRVLSASVSEKLSPMIEFFTDQVVGLENAFKGELDFRSEARNLNRFRRLFALTPSIRIPKVLNRYSTKRLMTMEKLEGENLQKAITSGTRVNRFDPENDKLSLRMDQSPEPKELLRRQAVEGLFGSVWQSFLYMTFVVGEVHADLHPGNLLAQSLEELEHRSNKVGVLDFAQTVKTRGFLTQPMKAGYALVTGNAESLAEQLVKMGSDPNYPIERLIPTIQRIFEEKGVKRRSLGDLMVKRPSADSPVVLSAALGEILKEAYTKLGYTASSRYAQIVRSLAPTSATLISLGQELPSKRIARIMIVGLAKTMTLGTLNYLILLGPTKIAERLELRRDTRRERLSERPTTTTTYAPSPRSCSAIFAPMAQ